MLDVDDKTGCNALALGSVGKRGQVVVVGVPSKAKILDNWSTSLLPWNKGSFVKSSANMQPTLQMSISGPYLSVPSSSSGERYHNVTTNCVSLGGGSLV